MGDKADLSHRGTAVCQGPYVIKISYIKTNRANFYFLKNILLFGFIFFFLNFKFVLPRAARHVLTPPWKLSDHF